MEFIIGITFGIVYGDIAGKAVSAWIKALLLIQQQVLLEAVWIERS